MEKIVFTLDTEEKTEFYVLEQTKLFGKQYILVTEEEEGDGDALILREISADKSGDNIYEIVEEDAELQAVAAVFESLLEDVSLLNGENQQV